MTPGKIAETIQHPGFTPEQLPELWKQIEADSRNRGTWVDCWGRWDYGMFMRCMTYLQHAKLWLILDGMSPAARHNHHWWTERGNDLFKQATPEQLLQALKHERQHPERDQQVSRHISASATIEQLTGAVIEQLPWDSMFLEYGGDPWRHIADHIQKTLLDGNENAWNIFLGIAEPGTPIGEAAVVAAAIENQHRPTRHRT